MPEKPIAANETTDDAEKSVPAEVSDDGSSGRGPDQKESSYYYDDACGYEFYTGVDEDFDDDDA